MTAPYWASDDGDVTLHLGDCLDVLRTLPADSVDAIVTDPPAGISFMGRTWDTYGSRARFVDWLTERLCEALRVLKPGGHALVWSLPRTAHWTAWAVEDAGFEVRDCVLHVFGSGFPKSLDVGKAIDKRPGVVSHAEFAVHLAERREAAGLSRADVSERVVGTRTGACWNWEHHQWPEAKWWPALRDLLSLDGKWGVVIAEAEREVVAAGYRVRRESTVQIVGLSDGEYDITAPATEDAARWDGWGTALKPGQEMWWLARKPLGAGTVAANVLRYGTGALNIDACKVAHASEANRAESEGKNRHADFGSKPPQRVAFGADDRDQVNYDGSAGRWPANLVFTHSAACEPAGTRRVRSSHDVIKRATGADRDGNRSAALGAESRPSGSRMVSYGDADGLETVEAWVCAADCPVGELDRQSGVSTSTGGSGLRSGRLGYGANLDGSNLGQNAGGLGDSGGASRFYPVFRYQAKAPASERPRLEDGTAHETVKPLGFISWAVRLVTPPGGTVLDMFAGSGPVAEACIIEGFRAVLIEQNPKSAELIRKRLGKPIQPVMFGLEGA